MGHVLCTIEIILYISVGSAVAVVLLVIFAVVSITVAIYRRRAVTAAKSELICGSLLYLIHIVQTTEVNPSYEPGNSVGLFNVYYLSYL